MMEKKGHIWVCLLYFTDEQVRIFKGKPSERIVSVLVVRYICMKEKYHVEIFDPISALGGRVVKGQNLKIFTAFSTNSLIRF